MRFLPEEIENDGFIASKNRIFFYQQHQDKMAIKQYRFSYVFFSLL